MKKIFALFIVIFVIQTSVLISQELNCVATINTEKIPSAQRDYLRDFASDVQRYLNDTRFTNEDLNEEKIQCNLEIVFQSAVSDNQYQAQVFIVSQRPVYNGDAISERTSPVLRIMDMNWQFTYMPNQRMNHDEMIFDPLTGFLDFYAYLIIGFDLETYVPMSGSDCFQKASSLVQKASNSSVGNDWKATSASYSKYGIVNEISDSKYKDFRIAFNNYFFDGVDLITTEPTKALDNMLKSIESINTVRRRQNPTSVIVKQFFDTKFREIADAFQTYPDRGVYDQLSTYDEEHRSTYQEWKVKP